MPLKVASEGAGMGDAATWYRHKDLHTDIMNKGLDPAEAHDAFDAGVARFSGAGERAENVNKTEAASTDSGV